LLDRAWRLAPQVAVRPEPFGALVYHFGTRRLSFLKSRALLDLVTALEAHESARDACRAAGVPKAEMPRYEHALATLADTGMIVARTVS
jgi:putative mycofactocin binding protein MftB